MERLAKEKIKKEVKKTLNNLIEYGLNCGQKSISIKLTNQIICKLIHTELLKQKTELCRKILSASNGTETFILEVIHEELKQEVG